MILANLQAYSERLRICQYSHSCAKVSRMMLFVSCPALLNHDFILPPCPQGANHGQGLSPCYLPIQIIPTNFRSNSSRSYLNSLQLIILLSLIIHHSSRDFHSNRAVDINLLILYQIQPRPREFFIRIFLICRLFACRLSINMKISSGVCDM